jgi:hypothetical protein
MDTMFTDAHIQVPTGNNIFDGGLPRQVVRRRFPGKGVVWFEKPMANGEGLNRITDPDVLEKLETKYSTERDQRTAKILNTTNFA